ncbi:Sulfotransferase domain-containing protein [Albimonas pacifica]|uniref:Sulfotransferase domain-containing protein n=2 Tax=Albimonas pacifica TaxID=1114924 RepID=A0A1I3GXM5_9RHOB|nr:Sulfotransferase domain-containing protein [Albimonas pacifica]
MMPSSIKKKGLQFYSPFTLALEMAARPLLPKKPHILIACMMKSGSTFLAHALAAHSGLRRVRLTPAWGAREQELCELRLSRYNHSAYVAQHHIKHSEWTDELIARYRLTPIVLVRDLFDIVVSLRDHIRRENRIMTVAEISERHAALPDNDLEEVIVDLAIPWFVQFYVGWRSVPNARFVRFEEMIADPAATMMEILKAGGVATNPEACEDALAQISEKKNRFNKGVVGRGAHLSDANKERIKKLLMHYPEVHGDPYIKDMLAR